MTGLELTNVVKRFGKGTILHDLSLRVQDGEFVSLLGPSGCGKTTTLRLIAGFIIPDAGAIALGGNRIDQLPSHRRDVGVVFQNYALFPHMSAAANVAFGLQQRRLGKSEIATRVKAALDMVQLGGLADRRPNQLSGGQQQRVALARALVIQPRVLLLDESLAALDKKMRVEMQVELRRIQREVGITTIFVTHDQEEAMTMSDRIAVMRNGQIEQYDTPIETYRHPVNGYVARALGEVNLLSGPARRNGPNDYALSVDGQTIRFNGGVDLIEGSEHTIGARPEQLIVTRTVPDGPAAQAVVDYVSFAGSLSRVGLQLGSSRLVAECPGVLDDLRPGDDAWVSWRPDAWQLLRD
jgi:spermidine/putrescine ABC transporter ATP-binding subunit